MKIAALVIISLIPMSALADQYACTNNKRPGQATVEASSMSEADYKFKEIFGENARPRCQNKSVTNSSDIFVRDVSFSHNMQLRPYLPSDLKSAGKPGYTCDSTGGFLGDADRGAQHYGECNFYISQSSASEWKIRRVNAGAATKVWRKRGGAWELWVEFEPPPDLYSVIDASPEARQYAAAHGTSTQAAGQQRGNQTDNAMPPAPGPNSNSNPVEDALKKGVGDLLKGFNR